MDFWMLKELNAQVLFDLREFVPKAHFVRENPLIINGVDTSHDEKWGYLAWALGERLLYESQAHLLTGSARQIAAIELLISLGKLTSFEITHHERPKALNDMLVSLRKYLNHMKKREAKPFVFLLESDSEQSEPQAATTANKHAVTDDIVTEEDLAALFDPVTVTVLEKMFPAQNSWQDWSYRAKVNGLINARVTRGLFNPYKAAKWFLEKKIYGWDLKRCHKVLAENLPACSINKAHLLIGNKGDDKDRLKEFPLIP